jgi:hypothetical protein
MSAATASPYLDAWKDYEAEVYIERKNSTTGRLEAAAGVTGAQFRISATEQGGAIGSLSASAVERSGSPGTYAATFDLAELDTELPESSYPHRSTVYLQFAKAGDVEVESFRKTVRRSRYS